MISNIFWGLIVLDTLAIAALTVMASRGRSSPDGAVGAWLLFIPPLVMLILAGLALITKSESVRMTGIYILGFPWIAIVIGPVYTAFQNYQTERSLAGDDDFSGLSRQLAHAITARDLELVKSLIPQVGDLNKHRGDNTLLLFALDAGREPLPPDSLAIVQALLDAGADPNLAKGNNYFPLTSAIYAGPELTLMLLNAGADPNRLDSADRPLWWDALHTDTDRGIETLQVLLDHKVDVTIRHSEGGPLGWAAHHAHMSHRSSWRAAWMLVEHGATWKDERQFGRPIVEFLVSDFNEYQHANIPIPECLRKLRLKYGLE